MASVDERIGRCGIHPVSWALLLFGFQGFGAAVAAEEWGLEARLACRLAVEDVRWQETLWPAHNLAPKPSRVEVRSDAAVRAWIEDRLRMETALEALYGQRIDDRVLQAELDRVGLQTRDPQRLATRFAVLGHNPRQVAECLLRPLLAERLLARHYSSGRHPDAVAFDDWWSTEGTHWPAARPTAGGPLHLPAIQRNGHQEAGTWFAEQYPEPRVGHSAVWTGSEVIVWGGSSETTGNLATGARYDPVVDAWAATATVGAPKANALGLAVWTGQEMLVLAGDHDGSQVSYVSRYDPTTDTWMTATTVGSPALGHFVRVAWTGTEMMVWDGMNVRGGRYRPDLDQWSQVTSEGAPSRRDFGYSMVWAGTEMIVWGGTGVGVGVLDSGGRYDPATDTWSATAVFGAPSARRGHVAVWTGSQMLVWGGADASGGRYDPVNDAWQPMATQDAPQVPWWRMQAVWADHEMIVWGGQGGTGGRYDPVTDDWSATSTKDAPKGVSGASAIWTGSEMIVWGGRRMDEERPPLDGGGRYDPDTDTWTPTARPALSTRLGHTAVWTGSEMIVWGGLDGLYSFLSNGGRYDPVMHSWLPMPTLAAPTARSGHTALWTGREVVIWGGYFNYESGLPGLPPVSLSSGGRYDPLGDAWLPTSISGAPSARFGHAAVWTGDEMIVWGGNPESDMGGRYDPEADEWLTMATTGAPQPRTGLSAVWTGDEMIVWGGRRVGGNRLNSGGRYRPALDNWQPTSATNSPAPRIWHGVVWTGEEMIVWGGSGSDGPLGDGARYVPGDDAWLEVAGDNAPAARSSHAAIWTGDTMIIWGGHGAVPYSAPLRTGARYDPVGDVWVGMPAAPSARNLLVAVWTGTRMIVWGGSGDQGDLLFDPHATVARDLVFGDGFE